MHSAEPTKLFSPRTDRASAATRITALAPYIDGLCEGAAGARRLQGYRATG